MDLFLSSDACIGRSVLVWQHPIKSLSMSAPLSVCPALSFVKIFYDILYMMIADHDI